jgi:hypothetical protein
MAQTGATVVVYELGEHSRVALAEGRLQLTTGEHGCTIQVRSPRQRLSLQLR